MITIIVLNVFFFFCVIATFFYRKSEKYIIMSQNIYIYFFNILFNETFLQIRISMGEDKTTENLLLEIKQKLKLD